MEKENFNQNVTCLLKEIYQRLKHISQKKELNMDHVSKLLADKNKMENLITFFQYLLDNEVYCDLVLNDFRIRWKPLIDCDLVERTRSR
jgi:hypothetical protein